MRGWIVNTKSANVIWVSHHTLPFQLVMGMAVSGIKIDVTHCLRPHHVALGEVSRCLSCVDVIGTGAHTVRELLVRNTTMNPLEAEIWISESVDYLTSLRHEYSQWAQTNGEHGDSESQLSLRTRLQECDLIHE